MTIFTEQFEVPEGAEGPRLAVKCNIDVAGHVTHCGVPGLREQLAPAEQDAPVVRTAREQGAVIVGLTVMPEFGLNATGVNEFLGTPPNPLDPERVPGGSSSGSTVAVARGLADVAYGTDSGGSCRIPPAACGVVGLKTTSGRLSTDGIGRLSPTLGSVGPIGPDVAGTALGMRLMEPGFEPASRPARRVARLHVDAEPWIDQALGRALEAAELEVRDLDAADVESWGDAYRAGGTLIVAEGWEAHGALAEQHPDWLSEPARNKLLAGRYVDEERKAEAHAVRERFRAALDALLDDVDLLVLPTLTVTPARFDDDLVQADLAMSTTTLPFNLSGHPALTLPVPTSGPFPAALQLVGRWGAEELLLATGQAIEDALS